MKRITQSKANKHSRPYSFKGISVSGFGYLGEGFRLLFHPHLRLFVIIPILINTIFLFILTSVLFYQFTATINYMMEWLPLWLEFLAYIIGIICVILILLFYGYSFSTITNFLAAPFYGVLAEKVEELATGKRVQGESLVTMIPRTILRELQKLWYFVWRSVFIFILTFIPLVGPLIGLAWVAWSMSVQYCDYAADNHQTPFDKLRHQLSGRLWGSWSFGGGVMLGTMVPLLNVFVMPAAVIGGSLYWLEELQHRK